MLHINLIKSKRLQSNNIFTRLAFKVGPSSILVNPACARTRGGIQKIGRARSFGRNIIERRMFPLSIGIYQHETVPKSGGRLFLITVLINLIQSTHLNSLLIHSVFHPTLTLPFLYKHALSLPSHSAEYT